MYRTGKQVSEEDRRPHPRPIQRAGERFTHTLVRYLIAQDRWVAVCGDA